MSKLWKAKKQIEADPKILASKDVTRVMLRPKADQQPALIPNQTS